MSRRRIKFEVEADYDGEHVEAVRFHGPSGEVAVHAPQATMGIPEDGWWAIDQLFALLLNHNDGELEVPVPPLGLEDEPRGGDVNFIAGQGAPGYSPGSIRFQIPGEDEDVLRIEPDGKAYVRGKRVDRDQLVYVAFRDWLSRALATHEGNATFEPVSDSQGTTSRKTSWTCDPDSSCGCNQGYYEVLGVPEDADAAAVKTAFRKAALEFHPDRNQGNPEAEARFRKATEAYGVLSDPEKRRCYDRFGKAGVEGLGSESAESIFDSFADMFGPDFLKGPR